nr:nuclear-pore anchor [Tanacetum cinerariifolium]
MEKTRKHTSGSRASPHTDGSIGDFVDPPPIAATGEVVTATPVSTTPLVVPAAQDSVETAKLSVTSKPKVAPHKLPRKLVRPQIVKPDQPKGDTDMSETVVAKTQSSARKRLSSLEEQKGSNACESSSADVAAPLVKKSKGSEQPHEGGVELQITPITLDIPKSVPLFTEENLGDENQTMKEEEELEPGFDTTCGSFDSCRSLSLILI